MRIMLTVVGEQGDRDVVLDCDDDTTIADATWAISGRQQLAKVVRLPRSRAPYGMSARKPGDAMPHVPEQRTPHRWGAADDHSAGDPSEAQRHDGGIGEGPADSLPGPRTSGGTGSVAGGPTSAPGTRSRSPLSRPTESARRRDMPQTGAWAPGGEPDPALWRNGRALDPRGLAKTMLRDGDKVTLDPRLARATLLEEPGGVAEVRVVGGPAAGTVHRLSLGVHIIGSDPMCTIAVADPAIAPEAVIMRITADAITVEPARRQQPPEAPRLKLKGRWADEVAELTARVAEKEAAALSSEAWRPPELDAEPLTEVVDWSEYALLTCGSSVFTLTAIEPRDAHLTPSPEGGLAYNRPPRLRPSEGRRAFQKPREPQRTEGMRLQLLAALLPAVLGVTLALVLNQWYFLLMALMTPVIMIGQWWSDRRHGKKQHKKALKEYRKQLREYEDTVEQARERDERVRRSEAPDPAQVLLTATGPRKRLWERRIHDQDALRLRIGLADLPANLELTEEQGDALEPPICRSVPVALAMRRLGVAGITGPRDRAVGLAGWLIGQAATLHSPRDLAIVVLSARADAECRWGWVRWLPHCAPRAGEECVALVGTDPESAGRRVAELTALIDERQNTAVPEFGKVPTGWDDLGGAEAPAFSAYDVRPYDVLVLVDGAQALRGLPGMPQVLRQGPRAGVYTLALDDDQRLLPEECATVTACDADGQVRLHGGGLDVIGSILADLVTPSWSDRLARALAPIRDVSRDDDSGSLPDAVRLLDLLGLSSPEGGQIASRWRARGSTEAVIGIGPEGRFAIDLAVDGPHGLIAGTTGAGKSELLQTLISSLAVANRPDQLTFVLIDYKGGAAFKECVRLPHTVGMVSDLDGHLTRRALESLAAEIRRRERLLLAAGAKDIDDYIVMAATHGQEPLPRLVLIIDEFAALVAELPDFVTGLVDIARRGRSLGIHLILATQRPAGVVTADIQANTSLRIALRVTEPMESADVIDMPDAADISKSTPGRCYVKSGAGAATAVQTARVGGRSPAPALADTLRDEGLSGSRTTNGRPGQGINGGAGVAHAGTPPRGSGNVRVIDMDWASLSRALPSAPQPAEDSAVTDLSLLTDAIVEAAELSGARQQPSPWLDPLPTQVTLQNATSAGFHQRTSSQAVTTATGSPAGTGPERPMPGAPLSPVSNGGLPSAAVEDVRPERPSEDLPYERTSEDVPHDRTPDDVPHGRALRYHGSVSWAEVAPLPFGITDRPWAQDRRPLTLDLAHGGHLLIAGAARSGRSTALRTIAGAIAANASPSDVHIHAIDCGSGALLPLVAMPHCGAVVTRDQLERVERLLARLRTEIGRRQQLLAEAGYASLTEYRAAGHRLPWLVLMLDRWEGYVAAFEGYDYGRLTEALLQLLREGPAVGLRAVVTGDRSCLVGQVSTVFDERLILRLADSSDYGLANFPIKELPSIMSAGRALAMGEHGIVESQIALLADDPSGPAQVAALQALARAAGGSAGRGTQAGMTAVPWRWDGEPPLRVDPLPMRITAEETLALQQGFRPPSPLWALVGAGGDTLTPLGVDLMAHGPAAVVAGPARTGRSSVLLTAAGQLIENGTPVIAVTPRRSPLRDMGGLLAVLDGNATELNELVSGQERYVVVVDDAELINPDSPLGITLDELLRSGRDGDHGLLIAGATGDLATAYRGFVAEARKGRTGLLLSVQSPADGDLFNVRLPRGAVGGPPGRGLLVTMGTLTPVQAALPT
jgi:S-DNA-T family DNA segregation ATPase FtsK/SpoIIIE